MKIEQSTNNMTGTAERTEMDWRRKEGTEPCEGVCVGLAQ